MGVKPERLRRNLMHDECSGVATSYCLNVPGSNRESVSEIQSIKEMYQKECTWSVTRYVRVMCIRDLGHANCDTGLPSSLSVRSVLAKQAHLVKGGFST